MSAGVSNIYHMEGGRGGQVKECCVSLCSADRSFIDGTWNKSSCLLTRLACWVRDEHLFV